MQKLFFETLGEGPDIVLLHGWGFHSGVWQFIASALSKEFRVTLIDLPGFGRSASLMDYTLEKIIERLLPIVPANALWLGWSLGGLIATKVALMHPERVSKLMCVASTPKFLKTTHWPGIEMSLLRKFNDALQTNYEETIKEFLLLQFYGSPLNKALIRWLMVNLFLYAQPSLETLTSSLHILETEDLRTALQQLTCPSLFLLGQRDTLVPAAVGKALVQLNPHITFTVFPKAGHAFFLSHESQFLAAVRQFANA